MKYIIFLGLLFSFSYANFDKLSSFEADFNQTITDEKGKSLSYSGHLIASKPQNAFWKYTRPVTKQIYIDSSKIIIIEPDLEQAIVKRINSNFNLFEIIKNAQKIDKNRFKARFEDSIFIIKTDKSFIKSLSYKDKFDNDVIIIFSKEKINKRYKKDIFMPQIPEDYDIIRE